MRKISKVWTAIAMIAVVFGLLSFIGGERKPWPVAAGDAAKVNPLKASATTEGEGKELYIAKCQSCHGKTGLGDGPKAKTLEGSAGDFTTKDYQSQTDGALFYKTYKGRDEMPAYKGKLEDDEIWKIIIYTRTLKK